MGKQFDDWLPIRNAIDKARAELGLEALKSIPEDEWNLVGTAIEKYLEGLKAPCCECKKPIDIRHRIVCYDCKAPLCEACAPRHFWPNGRPKTNS